MARLKSVLEAFTAFRDEELDPWVALWRRIKYFYETNQDFRLQVQICVLGLALLIVVGPFLLWMVAGWCSRKKTAEQPSILRILDAAQENRRSIEQVAQLMKRPNPEPPALTSVQEQQPEATATITTTGEGTINAAEAAQKPVKKDASKAVKQSPSLITASNIPKLVKSPPGGGSVRKDPAIARRVPQNKRSVKTK